MNDVTRAILNLYAHACPSMAYTDDLQALENIRDALERLQRPEYIEGQLMCLANGRFLLAAAGSFQLTSGDPFEVWDGEQYVPTRMESTRGGYYAVDMPPLKEGDHARIRKAKRY